MLAWKGKEWHFAFLSPCKVVNAGFVVWYKGQLFYRRVKGQGLKPPLVSMCARPCVCSPSRHDMPAHTVAHTIDI